MNRHMLIVLSLFTGTFIFSSDILRRVEPCIDAAWLGDGVSGPSRPCDGVGVDVVSRFLVFLLCYHMVARSLIQLESARDERERAREREGGLDLRGLGMIEDQLSSNNRRPHRRCSVARTEGAARPG